MEMDQASLRKGKGPVSCAWLLDRRPRARREAGQQQWRKATVIFEYRFEPIKVDGGQGITADHADAFLSDRGNSSQSDLGKGLLDSELAGRLFSGRRAKLSLALIS